MDFDYKAALHAIIDRIPDDNSQALRKLYEMAKRIPSATRCAPTAKPDRRKLARELRGLLDDIAMAARFDDENWTL